LIKTKGLGKYKQITRSDFYLTGDLHYINSEVIVLFADVLCISKL